MRWPQWLLVFYGLFNLVLGIEAFVRVRSLPSLLGGGLAGIAVLVCAWLASRYPRIAYISAAVICLLLIGKFASKDADHFYPNIVEIVVSGGVFLALLGAHFAARRRARGIATEA